jgi:hypothetical protein
MNKVTGFIFKPSRRKDGRKVKSPYFVLRLKIDGRQIGKDIPLHVRDNQVADKMKAELIREKERELSASWNQNLCAMRRKSRCVSMWLISSQI